jgi:hypothetical protein
MITKRALNQIRGYIEEGMSDLDRLTNHTFTGTGSIPDIKAMTFQRALDQLDYLQEIAEE